MAETVENSASGVLAENKKKLGRKRACNVQLFNNEHEYSRASMKKMKSKKKGRRFENLCHLLSLFSDDILADDDYDLDDLVDLSHNSLFYELFQNEAYLQKWYTFLAKTGEEQEIILDELKRTMIRVDESTTSGDESLPESKKNDENATQESHLLKNRLELGYEAFNKIDKNIKPVLKKQFSLEYLLKYEDQIIPVFQSNETNEHCIQNIDSGIERMIVHGLCQYLDLNSKSYRLKEGTVLKMIKTENGKFFIPPILLSEFLRERFFSTTE